MLDSNELKIDFQYN